MKNLILTLTFVSLSAHAEFKEICTMKFGQGKAIASFDQKAKKIQIRYQTVNGTRNQVWPTKVDSWSHLQAGEDAWNSRMQAFRNGIDKRVSRPVDFSKADRLLRIGNDTIEGLGQELWIIGDKDNRTVAVLATEDVLEYYVCPPNSR